jgi:ubiquinone/menaquinone biosynthesis C-methylase UbiE
VDGLGNGKAGKMNKAEFFDQSHDDDWASRDYTDDEHHKLNRYLQIAGVEKGQKVLEPGCGTGRFTCKLAELVSPQGEIVAVDISGKMVEECLKRAGHFPNVRILQMPADKIVYPSAYFDCIFCLCVFPHFDDKAGVLRVFRNILKPTEVLVIAHLQGSRILNDMHRKVGGVVKEDRIPPFSEVKKLFENDGFRIDFFRDQDDGYYLLARCKNF